MNAKQALTNVVDDLGDLDSFVETFDADFWTGDEGNEELAERGLDPYVFGRFGENAQANTNDALKVLEGLVEAVEKLQAVWEREDGAGIEDEHLEAVDRVITAYRGPWGADVVREVIHG